MKANIFAKRGSQAQAINQLCAGLGDLLDTGLCDADIKGSR